MLRLLRNNGSWLAIAGRQLIALKGLAAIILWLAIGRERLTVGRLVGIALARNPLLRIALVWQTLLGITRVWKAWLLGLLPLRREPLVWIVILLHVDVLLGRLLLRGGLFLFEAAGPIDDFFGFLVLGEGGEDLLAFEEADEINEEIDDAFQKAVDGENGDRRQDDGEEESV